MSVRHRQFTLLGTIAWQTEWEIGIDVSGYTWTGSVKQFQEQWEETT